MNSDSNLKVDELLEVQNINQNIDSKTRTTEIPDIEIPILLHIETKTNHQDVNLLISGQDLSHLISDQDFNLQISGQDIIIDQQLINRPHVIDVDGRDTWR